MDNMEEDMAFMEEETTAMVDDMEVMGNTEKAMVVCMGNTEKAMVVCMGNTEKEMVVCMGNTGKELVVSMADMEVDA